MRATNLSHELPRVRDAQVVEEDALRRAGARQLCERGRGVQRDWPSVQKRAVVAVWAKPRYVAEKSRHNRPQHHVVVVAAAAQTATSAGAQ